MTSASSCSELWGTFAVDDHLRPRAFVAETILFDRVVVPLPPKASEAEHRDWIRSGWQPDRLLEIRKRLGSLAIGVPWTPELRAQWRAEYSSEGGRPALQARLGSQAAIDAHAIKAAPPDLDGRYISRSVLARRLETPIDGIADQELLAEIRALDLDPAGTVEVVVGYGSLAKYRSDAASAAKSASDNAGPATLFVTWDFLVPEDSTLSDNELLLRAVALSSKSEFRDARRRFHEWRRQLAANGASLTQAQAEMSRCLAVFNEITAKERRRNRCLTALQAVATAAPLAALAHHGAGADAASVVLNLASMAAERVIPHYTVSGRESVAALVHDSREAFGWRPRA